jgi:KaiC/GvpD/RAD55 family RecA-like ATPase
MKRIKLGINGIDTLFEEGVPAGSNILVYGQPGSGKTVFGLQFLYMGAHLYNEPGVYVNFDETKSKIIDQCNIFGWDIQKYISKKKIALVNSNIDEINRDFLNQIISEVKKIGAKRLVIDSIALLSLSPSFSNETKYSFLAGDKMKVAYDVQQFLYNIIHTLSELDVTIIYSTFSGENEHRTIDGISEYLCDGIVNLRVRQIGKAYLRTLEIMKMRQTFFQSGIHPFHMTREGINVEESK